MPIVSPTAESTYAGSMMSGASEESSFPVKHDPKLDTTDFPTKLASMDRSQDMKRRFSPSPWRWFHLFWLCLLNILNNVVCYTYSPVSDLALEVFGGNADLGLLTSSFFVTNLLVSFHGAKFIDAKGLRCAVTVGAALQAVGCWVRWVAGLDMVAASAKFALCLVGQTIAAFSQPSITNTPPALSVAWFPADEMALATSLAVGANQFGITVAYLCATQVVSEADELSTWSLYVAIACTAAAIGVALCFRGRAPEPPSRAAEEKANGQGESAEITINDVKSMLRMPGVLHACFGFTVAESLENVYSTYLNSILTPFGYSDEQVGYLGCLFFVAVFVGSTFFGLIVGIRYKTVILVCSGASIISVVFLQMSMLPSNIISIGVGIFLLGFFIGPLQPISGELAVEVSYPVSENLTFGIQQAGASLFSAIFVILLDSVHSPASIDYVMLIWVSICLLVMATFNAPLRRTDISNWLKSTPLNTPINSQPASPVMSRTVSLS